MKHSTNSTRGRNITENSYSARYSLDSSWSVRGVPHDTASASDSQQEPQEHGADVCCIAARSLAYNTARSFVSPC